MMWYPTIGAGIGLVTAIAVYVSLTYIEKVCKDGIGDVFRARAVTASLVIGLSMAVMWGIVIPLAVFVLVFTLVGEWLRDKVVAPVIDAWLEDDGDAA